MVTLKRKPVRLGEAAMRIEASMNWEPGRVCAVGAVKRPTAGGIAKRITEIGEMEHDLGFMRARIRLLRGDKRFWRSRAGINRFVENCDTVLDHLENERKQLEKVGNHKR